MLYRKISTSYGGFLPRQPANLHDNQGHADLPTTTSCSLHRSQIPASSSSSMPPGSRTWIAARNRAWKHIPLVLELQNLGCDDVPMPVLSSVPALRCERVSKL